MSLLDVYENFSLDNPTITLSVIIWGVYAGLLIAGIASVYNKNYLGAAVRALVAAGATSADCAAVLADTGIKAGRAYARNLRDGKPLRRYIAVANPEECRIKRKTSGAAYALRRFFTGSGEGAQHYDLRLAKLYVPEEKRIQAELRYDKKGSAPWLIAVAAAVYLALAAALYFCIPKLLDLTDSMITMYKNL